MFFFFILIMHVLLVEKRQLIQLLVIFSDLSLSIWSWWND